MPSGRAKQMFYPVSDRPQLTGWMRFTVGPFLTALALSGVHGSINDHGCSVFLPLKLLFRCWQILQVFFSGLWALAFGSYYLEFGSIAEATDFFIALTYTTGASLSFMTFPMLLAPLPSIKLFLEQAQPVFQKYLSFRSRLVLVILALVLCAFLALHIANCAGIVMTVGNTEIAFQLDRALENESHLTHSVLLLGLYSMSMVSEFQLFLVHSVLVLTAAGTGLVFRNICHLVLVPSGNVVSDKEAFKDYCRLSDLAQDLAEDSDLLLLFLYLYDSTWILTAALHSRHENMFIGIYYFMILLAWLTLLTLACTFLHDQAHKIGGYLEEMLEKESTGPEYLSHFVRLYRLNNSPTGLTVGGIAVVDRRFACSVVGLIITYTLMSYYSAVDKDAEHNEAHTHLNRSHCDRLFQTALQKGILDHAFESCWNSTELR